MRGYGATSRGAGAAAPAPSNRWLHQTFFRDTGRIKGRERYGRAIRHEDVAAALASSIGRLGSSGDDVRGLLVPVVPILIPDGSFLRKYLRLIEALLDIDNDGSSGCIVVLLESAAELADYRNSTGRYAYPGSDGGNEDRAPVTSDDAASAIPQPEAAAPNERSRIVRMVERHGLRITSSNKDAAEGTPENEQDLSSNSSSSRGIAIPFPDLSYRYYADTSGGFLGDDEFDALDLANATIEHRARRSLVRAGRMFYDAAAVFGEGGEVGMQRRTTDIVLLTNDKATVQTELSYSSSGDGDPSPHVLSLNSLEVVEYVSNAMLLTKDQKQALVDLVERCEDEYVKRNAFKHSAAGSGATAAASGGRVPYLGEVEVTAGLKSGKYFRGKLDVTKANFREAYVSVASSTNIEKQSMTKHYIDDQVGNFNRALHNDTVIIEPLPEHEWGRPIGRRRLVHIQQKTSEEDDDDVAANMDDEGPTVPSARVVALQTSSRGNIARRQYVATAQPPSDRTTSTGGDSAALVIPMDIRIPKIRIRTRMGVERLLNKRILVEVDGWDIGSSYPKGHVVKIMGDIGNLETEISCLLIEHGIDLPPFSKSALACLPTVEGTAWQIPADEIARRRDLRTSHRVFSVDPAGCQDIDDTMSAKVLPNGDIEIGVHIADVTHFVPHNSALDREARFRGTTFYLVDRRFDMLPSLLSSDLCSLHGNVDRLAVSVIWTMSSDLERVKSCWYGRTCVHNCAAMLYEQAHKILHDMPPDDLSKPPPPPLTAGAPVPSNIIPALKSDLSILTNLARKLRKNREDVGGAVDLSSGGRGSELKFVLDERGNPVKVSPKTEMEIHHTIAELMIFANEYVARRIHQAFPDIALLRNHRYVQEGRFDELETTLKTAGIQFDGRSNKALADTLKAAKLGGKYGAIVDSLLQSLATRAMSEAQYICSGAQEGDSGFAHYGLGIDKYTHFTSPIRRYADVVVHRELLAAVSDIPSSTINVRATIDRAVLESLPGSKTMTVLGRAEDDGSGDDYSDLDGDELLDSLIEGASDLALEAKKSNDAASIDVSTGLGQGRQLTESTSHELYQTSQVVKICERLNHMNRIAKLSSMDCQRLFLSLYFQHNTEVTSGVVLSTRVNGLIVYVPKFDLKGPVFLSDRDGKLQMDPTIVGLAPDSGRPPSSGFGIVEGCRLLPEGKCVLNGERLDITVRGGSKTCSFQPLDVVTVQLSCDLSEMSARVPPPRLHLVTMGQKAVSRATATKTITAKDVQDREVSADATDAAAVAASRDIMFNYSISNASLFEALSSIKVEANLNVPLRYTNGEKATKGKGRTTNFPGRISFGDFKNPDTLKAKQDAAAQAASEAATQRRSLHTQAAQGDYNATKQIEREATARMQRLAAEKRQARRRKAG